jgi:PAS domain S-box-containing protein/putative nucleotidyltransferase with HDIG domain
MIKNLLRKSENLYDFNRWLDWLADVLTLLASFILPISFIFALPIFIAQGNYFLVFLDIVLWVLCLLRAFVPGAVKYFPHVIWLVILYVTTISLFITLGPGYARSAWMILCAVIAAIIYRVKGAIISSAFNVIILFVLFFFYHPTSIMWSIVYRDGVGNWLMFLTSMALISICSSIPVGFLINRFDKSLQLERKNKEKLQESERRYRFLTEKMSDILWIADINLRTTYISPSVKNVLGFSPEERMRQTLDEQLTPHSLSLVSEFLSKELALEKRGNADPDRKLTIELEYYHKDGSTRWMDLVISGLRNDQGILTGIHGVSRDITERKLAEEIISKSERRYSSTFHLIPNPMAVTEVTTGEIVNINDAFICWTGYSRTELIGVSTRDIHLWVNPEDRERITGELKETGEVNGTEVMMRQKNGHIRNVLFSARLIEIDQEHYLLTLAQDITERKLAEDKLQQTLESLKKAVGTTIQVLVSALETRDPYTSGHQSRVADLACAIATEMGLAEETIEGIRMAGTIHDIGKLSIPAEILTKPAKLMELEFSLVKEHAKSGYEMLKEVESPWQLAEIVYQHHERMNGTGYPRKLRGDEILIEARILAVADVVEAMASHRPYRASLGIKAALEEIEKNKGILYDNAVADACLRLFREKGYQLT